MGWRWKFKSFVQLFLFKNNKRFALSGVSLDRLSDVRCPEAENIRSEGALDAIMLKYL